LLSVEQLEELDDMLKAELEERQTEILTRLNREEKLSQLLDLLGLSSLLRPEPLYECYKSGKIVVIGESQADADVLLAIAKDLGIEKKRFELCLEYDAAKRFDCRKMQWNPTYSLVLVGPMPHSGAGKGDYSSIITAIESEEGYPPVERLGTSTLKITKSDFRNKLSELLRTQKIA